MNGQNSSYFICLLALSHCTREPACQDQTFFTWCLPLCHLMSAQFTHLIPRVPHKPHHQSLPNTLVTELARYENSVQNLNPWYHKQQVSPKAQRSIQRMSSHADRPPPHRLSHSQACLDRPLAASPRDSCVLGA